MVSTCNYWGSISSDYLVWACTFAARKPTSFGFGKVGMYVLNFAVGSQTVVEETGEMTLCRLPGQKQDASGSITHFIEMTGERRALLGRLLHLFSSSVSQDTSQTYPFSAASFHF